MLHVYSDITASTTGTDQVTVPLPHLKWISNSCLCHATEYNKMKLRLF